jgi:beta-glucanase (GH16 family)
MSIQNGVLNLYMHTENGVHMVAAPVPKIPGGSGSDGGLLHGRYVVRFRSDALPGYKTAWLLWPDSGVWPRDGEIDFPEGNLDGTINAFMHYMNATSGSQQDAYSTSATYPAWHTAVIEWMPSYCSFSLDGRVIGTSTSNIPSTPMHWVLQSETTTDGLVPSDTTAGNIQIDWVAVYTPA